MACGYCKGTGHTRPTCPVRKAERAAWTAKPVEPHAECLPRRTESPWPHVGREQGPGIFSKHTWRHNVTGEFVTATVPTPPPGSGVIHPEPRHPGDAAAKSRHSATLGRWRKVAQHFSG